jgi:hypothetical protein
MSGPRFDYSCAAFVGLIHALEDIQIKCCFLTFGEDCRLIKKFTDSVNFLGASSPLQHMVDRYVSDLESDTNLFPALDYVINDETFNDTDPDLCKVVIVATDGRTNNESACAYVAEQISSEALMFAIGLDMSSQLDYLSRVMPGAVVKNYDGQTIATQLAEDIYNEIGQFSIIGDNIFKSGADLCILQLGNNIYLTFDTKGKDKDYNTVIYKHFYKIGPTANSIEEVKSRMLMNIFPASPKANETINININSDEDTEILFTTMDGKLCNRQKIPAGQNQSQIVGGVPGGAYIVSLKNKNGINNSKKIIVR